MTTPANQPAEDSPEEQHLEERSWADEAAEARTTDDPRIRPPHDRLGVPSTEDHPRR